MLRTRFGTRALATVFLLVILVPCSMPFSKERSTRVEIWRRGDDALTMKLADAVKLAFSESQQFELGYGRRNGTLIVFITSHVQWKRVGKKTRISYKVEFDSLKWEKLGQSTGQCWDDQLHMCAIAILRDAEEMLEQRTKDGLGTLPN